MLGLETIIALKEELGGEKIAPCCPFCGGPWNRSGNNRSRPRTIPSRSTIEASEQSNPWGVGVRGHSVFSACRYAYQAAQTPSNDDRIRHAHPQAIGCRRAGRFRERLENRAPKGKDRAHVKALVSTSPYSGSLPGNPASARKQRLLPWRSERSVGRGFGRRFEAFPGRSEPDAGRQDQLAVTHCARARAETSNRKIGHCASIPSCSSASSIRRTACRSDRSA